MYARGQSVFAIGGRSCFKSQHRLRFCTEKLHKSLGIESDGSRHIRVFDQKELDPRVVALRDKLIYSDYLQEQHLVLSYSRRMRGLKAHYQMKQKEKSEHPAVSVLIEKLGNVPSKSEATSDNTEARSSNPLFSNKKPQSPEKQDDKKRKKYVTTNNDLLSKYGMAFKDYTTDTSCNLPENWLTDYEQYNDFIMDKDNTGIYGTPNPSIPTSGVPCMGCGVILHCKNPAIPGYLPSEIFLGLSQKDLQVTVCQRCHFLRLYNIALDVKVSPQMYSDMLRVLKEKQCTILMIIDATDLPCSIWPGLADILHAQTKVIVAVNKIDLLPVDSGDFFTHITQQVLTSVTSITGVTQEQRIAGIQLISAKTGFGIERLINFLWEQCPRKDDVYLVGCTNVGKSSLFNRLINSDYCKLGFAELMQTATTSPWPGTTLNMLKFPIHRLSGRDSFARYQRTRHLRVTGDLMQVKRDSVERHNDIKYATLEEDVGRTIKPNSIPLEVERRALDNFSVKSTVKEDRKATENFGTGGWCYDTPGTLHTDQILDLLTIDELTYATPRQIISPKSLFMYPNSTMFLAGVGRLDYVEGHGIVRCTVFASGQLPITICRTCYADEVYATLLETEAFVIPINDPERLKVWPRLQSKTFEVTGVGLRQSAADIVLSCIGWVALAVEKRGTGVFQAWTPQGRGIHLRTPALLRKSIAFRGRRISGTPLYGRGRQLYFGKVIPNN